VVICAGLLATAVVVAVSRSDDAATYTPGLVESTFNHQGLAVRQVSAPEGVDTHGDHALTPIDGAFTVLVLRSDSEAKKAFRQYEGVNNPTTFYLRDGNLIVLADGSNSSVPLSVKTRARIWDAVSDLRRDRSRP
jgi:hypothetical protein